MNQMGLSLQHLLRYADELNDMLNWGRIMGAALPTWIKTCFNALEKFPVHLQPKSLIIRHQLGTLCLPCFRIQRSMVKMWILHRTVKFCWSFGMQFAENLQANWQEDYASMWQCQTPWSPSNQGENLGTKVGTSWTSAYSPDLGPTDFHLFGPFKNHVGGKRSADDKEVEAEVQKWQVSKIFYAAGFDALVKRWDKCMNVEKQMFLPVSDITFFTLYIHFYLFTDCP
jgi:hypothetical protein